MTGKQYQEDIYFRVMRLLQENPQMTQRELARKLGGVNYCMKALIAKGWVKVQNFSHSQNKLGYVYVLSPAGIAQKTLIAGRFLKRKMEEYEALRAKIASLRKETGTRGINSQNH